MRKKQKIKRRIKACFTFSSAVNGEVSAVFFKIGAHLNLLEISWFEYS